MRYAAQLITCQCIIAQIIVAQIIVVALSTANAIKINKARFMTSGQSEENEQRLYKLRNNDTTIKQHVQQVSTRSGS